MEYSSKALQSKDAHFSIPNQGSEYFSCLPQSGSVYQLFQPPFLLPFICLLAT